MHYHLEIILPPNTNNLEAAIEKVLEPFSENYLDEDEEEEKQCHCLPRHSFYDWYVVGGRWAGHKLVSRYDKERREEFHQWLLAEGITVSSLQCGKRELDPVSQIPKVDAKWNEMFPNPSGFIACPLFAHSNDQYREAIEGDIAPVSDVRDVSCSHLIVAGPNYAGELRALYMCQDETWNGVNFEPTRWDGKIGSAVDEHNKRASGHKDDYREQVTVGDDWITVTVDYHS